MTNVLQATPASVPVNVANDARFPIRIKILVGVLVVIMLVIAAITATMANLFHQDKTAYIHGLTALMAQHASREARTIIHGHANDLAAFEGVMLDDSLMVDQRTRVLGELFGSYRDFVAAGLVMQDAEPVLVYDDDALGAAGMTVETLGAGLGAGLFPGVVPEPGRLIVRNLTTTGELPLLGIAYRERGSETIVIAWVRLAGLFDIAAATSAFSTSLLDGAGRLFADVQDGFRPGESRPRWLPEQFSLASGNTAATSRELDHNGQPLIVGFAPVGINDLVVAVRIPKSSAYLTSRALLKSLLVVALVLFAGAGLLTLIFSQRLTRPLERLSRAARAVGRGHFDVRIETNSSDEIGLLSNSFNQMTRELQDRDSALEQANIALIQSEKMSAFGQIGAGIAHEVKNPLAGILGYAQLGLSKLDPAHPVTRHLTIIEKETRRCTDIIGNLMKFARRESSIKQALEVNDFVEDALAIVEHQLGINGIELKRELAGDLPAVMGNSNQLEQVLVNFLINAQQAMAEDGGQITVASRAPDLDSVEILVRDDGPGIPPEIIDKIFEPFFSTKPSGKGTGLGLAVTYGIVEDHGGAITVQSQTGKGTTFIISLPATAAWQGRPAAGANVDNELTTTGSSAQ